MKLSKSVCGEKDAKLVLIVALLSEDQNYCSKRRKEIRM